MYLSASRYYMSTFVALFLLGNLPYDSVSGTPLPPWLTTGTTTTTTTTTTRTSTRTSTVGYSSPRGGCTNTNSQHHQSNSPPRKKLQKKKRKKLPPRKSPSSSSPSSPSASTSSSPSSSPKKRSSLPSPPLSKDQQAPPPPSPPPLSSSSSPSLPKKKQQSPQPSRPSSKDQTDPSTTLQPPQQLHHHDHPSKPSSSSSSSKKPPLPPQSPTTTTTRPSPPQTAPPSLPPKRLEQQQKPSSVYSRSARPSSHPTTSDKGLVDEEVFTVTSDFTSFCEELEQGVVVEEEEETTTREGGVDQVQGSPPCNALRYGVVAILGCQSSGKSTLLNAVFGTNFPVLDVAVSGITRTTKGVWIDMEKHEGTEDTDSPSASSSSSLLARLKAKSPNVPVVVMDIEGLDSTARGESSEAFDTRLAGMAVSAADVVILNLWAADIQRRASSAGHETVFRALAQQRGAKHHGKRQVVAVLRDMEDVEVVEEASQLLISDLREAWKAAGRDPSEALQGVELRVMGLRHFRYKAKEFKRGIKQLRSIFRDSSIKEYSFREVSEGRIVQPVALREFPRFIKDLWSSLSSGPLPAAILEGQQEGEEVQRIQSFILQRIVDSCCEEAQKGVSRLRAKVESAGEMPILEFGADCQALMDRAVKALRDRAAKARMGTILDRATLQAKEEEVLTVLGREVEPLFRAHLEALRQFYHGKFQDKFSGLYLPVKQYDKEASHMVQDICLTFSKAAKAAVPPQMAHRWDITGSMEQLKEDLDEEVADRRLEMEVAFPPEVEPPTRMFRLKWWRGIAIKALVLYLNYLQSAQSGRAMRRAARRRQDKYPPFPLF